MKRERLGVKTKVPNSEFRANKMNTIAKNLELRTKNYFTNFAPVMTQEQLKSMRDRVVVLRRFL